MTEKQVRKPRVTGDRVLLRMRKASMQDEYTLSKDGWYEKLSPAGFVIERISKDKYELYQQSLAEGYVVQVGTDAFKLLGSGKAWAKVGDLVSCNKYSGELLSDIGDGEIYREISDSDILLVWEGEGLND